MAIIRSSGPSFSDNVVGTFGYVPDRGGSRWIDQLNAWRVNLPDWCYPENSALSQARAWLNELVYAMQRFEMQHLASSQIRFATAPDGGVNVYWVRGLAEVQLHIAPEGAGRSYVYCRRDHVSRLMWEPEIAVVCTELFLL